MVGIICHLVEIGLIQFSNFGGAMAPPSPSAPTDLQTDPQHRIVIIRTTRTSSRSNQIIAKGNNLPPPSLR